MSYRVVLPLLLAVCLLFAAIVVIELEAAGADDAVVAEIAARPEAATAIRRQPSQRFDDLVATTLARPLFSSSRRPPQSAPAGGAGDSDLTDRRLTGIVTAPGRRLAIFAISGDKPLTVAEGDEVSGWRVESITPREVSLTGPTGTKTLQPKLDPNLAAPPAPPPGANAAGRPPNPLPPGAPRPAIPPNAAAAAPPNPGVPINVPGAPPRPLRPRQQR
jgi:general secretion pathway protein N